MHNLNLNISIIIPVLNEADRITQLVKSLLEIKDLSDEIIVVDGGSTDGTLDKALSLGVKAISANKSGRAAQMNLGAKISQGGILWFVHADSRVSSDSLSAIRAAIKSGAYAGFFRLKFYDINLNDRFLKFIERTSHIRAKNYCLIFGDQALFIRRDIFNDLGGFADLALMEDWELSRRFVKLNYNKFITALDTEIGTSARRYIQHGRFKTWLKMNFIKFLYIMGVDTKILRRIYG